MDKQAFLIKMNGIGNEILVIDMRGCGGQVSRETVLRLAVSRETTFDQMMIIYPARQAATDALIEIWNRDGTKAGACGNGMRCVVAYLANDPATDAAKEEFHFETASGFVHARYLGAGRVEVDMGRPAVDWRGIPTSRPLADTLHVDMGHINMGLTALADATLVSMGNPHCIFFVEEEVDKIALEYYGAILEHDPLFVDRANISLVRLLSPVEMRVRTWERGVGLTRACGTAACAAVVAAVRRGLSNRQVEVHLPGGKLQIEWRQQSGHVLMVGETKYEFSGHVDPASGYFVKRAQVKTDKVAQRVECGKDERL